MALANPLGLALAASLGVLILLYLRARRRETEIVPSLLLWESLRTDVVRTRRFDPNLLFLLQAAALACLTLALAQPYLEWAGGAPAPRRRVLVLDVTASTQATDLSPSRFAVLRDELMSRVDQADPTDEFALITADAAPELRLGFSGDREALRQAVAGIAPRDTGGSLSQALSLARDLGSGDEKVSIEIFTDSNGVSTLEATAQDDAEIFAVGLRNDNLGIASLDVSQGRFTDSGAAVVTVRVTNDSDRERHGMLAVEVGEAVVMQRGFTIAAGGAEAFVSSEIPGPGRVRARLIGGDLLAVDDIAYGWVRPPIDSRLRIVAPASGYAEQLASLVRSLGLEVESCPPEATSPACLAPLRPEKDLLLVVGVGTQEWPTEWPAVNALMVYPPPGNPLLHVGATVDGAEAIDWNQRHPVFAALSPLPALPFAHARIVAAPVWGEVLLWARTEQQAFPLAFAGQVADRRYAVLAFDLRAEGVLTNDRLDRLLLLTSLLGWLLPDDSTAAVLRAGESATGDDRARLVHVGEYTRPWRGGTQTLLVNSGDATESAIGAVPRLPRREESVAASVDGPRQTPQPIASWIYGLGLLLLAIEWAVSRGRAA